MLEHPPLHSFLFTIYRFYVRLSQKTRLIDYIGIVSKSAGSMLKNIHYRRNCCHRKCSPAPYSPPYVILIERHLFLHISHMRLNSNAFRLDSAIPNATRVHQCNNIFYGLLFTFAHFLGFNFCKSTNELHFIVSRFMLMANKQIPNHQTCTMNCEWNWCNWIPFNAGLSFDGDVLCWWVVR